MADGTKIEWTDATWNPITGCAVVSPGCTNCYAMKLAGTRLRNHPSRAGLTKDTKAGPVWTGEVRFNEKTLLDPLRWKRPRMIFVVAHGDLFSEAVPDEWIDRIFAVMALCPQHTFQVLTKRPERMRDYLTTKLRQHRIAASQVELPDPAPPTGRWPHLPMPNVWLGVSVEDQKRADERIPDLLATPAAIRWISAEPLLGPINLRRIRIAPDHHTVIDALDGYAMVDTPGRERERAMLDWVVAGGESGTCARPSQPDWFRSLRGQCATASVPFLFKQWGNHRPCSDASGPYMLPCSKAEAGRHLDGVLHDGFPIIERSAS
ncbi:MAG TPA: phage Gp37/Gp68 family protein [Pseudorhizobium sp.]|nr:phage Gp37/Gp68 family protein [Pseudorhizobium sp.]